MTEVYSRQILLQVLHRFLQLCMLCRMLHNLLSATFTGTYFSPVTSYFVIFVVVPSSSVIAPRSNVIVFHLSEQLSLNLSNMTLHKIFHFLPLWLPHTDNFLCEVHDSLLDVLRHQMHLYLTLLLYPIHWMMNCLLLPVLLLLPSIPPS